MKNEHNNQKIDVIPGGTQGPVENSDQGPGGQSGEAGGETEPPFPLMIVCHLGQWFVVIRGQGWFRLSEGALQSLREDCIRKLKQKL